MKTIKLIMVTGDNNNKYYNMFENSDGTFRAEYGRVDVTTQKKTYPMGRWDEIYRQKTKKGYKDVTHLYADTGDDSGASKIITTGIYAQLQAFANHTVQQNYRVSSAKVTQAMIDEAQKIVDKLSAKAGTLSTTFNNKRSEFNDLLLELWMTIPRKMKDTKKHLVLAKADDMGVIRQKVFDEQQLLDVMRGQAVIKPQSTTTQTDPVYDITIESVVDPDTLQLIQRYMQECKKQFKAAYEVKNRLTDSSFAKFVAKRPVKERRLFWHGSRNENWWSILNSGLVLRPANAIITGKMFGYGLYFADKFKKSLGYTSLRGSYWAKGGQSSAYLSLYDVHVGNMLQKKKHEGWMYQLNEQGLKKHGDYDSLFAEGGIDLYNNEYIVYNQSQCTARYLVEVS